MSRSQKDKKRLLSRRFRKGDSGLTSAIILIAFIIVAASIAFVILSLGGDFISSTKDTGNTAQEQTQSAVIMVGDPVGLDIYDNALGTETQNQKIDMVLIKVQLAATASGDIDFGANSLTIDFLTATTVQTLTYNASLNDEFSALETNGLEADVFQYGIRELRGDGDLVLEATEQFEIVVFFSGEEIDTSTEFQVKILPAVGNELSLVRTAPTKIDKVNSL